MVGFIISCYKILEHSRWRGMGVVYKAQSLASHQCEALGMACKSPDKLFVASALYGMEQSSEQEVPGI